MGKASENQRRLVNWDNRGQRWSRECSGAFLRKVCNSSAELAFTARRTGSGLFPGEATPLLRTPLVAYYMLIANINAHSLSVGVQFHTQF